MMLRFKVAGIPVHIHFLFILTALALGAGRLDETAALAVWVAAVFSGVLVHELGHALAFRRLGGRPSISLHGLGGTTTEPHAERLTPRQDVGVSLAGPGAGLLVGGLVLGAWHLTPLGQVQGLARTAVWDVLWVNVGWALINLLPLLPLDGGHVLTALLRRPGRDAQAVERRVHLVSLWVAVGVLAGAVWLKSPWAGVLALIAGAINLQAWWRLRQGAPRRFLVPMHEQALRNLPARRPARPQPPAQPSSHARSPRAERPPPRPAPPPPEEPPEVPLDSRLVGELLLDGGLPSLAVHSLRQAFLAQPSPLTAHPLVLALLDAGRHAELAELLQGPHAPQVGAATLELLAARASSSGQPTLAVRALEVLRARPPKASAPREDEPC